MCFNNCDFAIPGSPNKAILIYPLILKLSPGVEIVQPPAICKSKAFLTLFNPYIYGAIDFANF